MRIFDDLVDGNKPLYKAVLGARRWFSFALPKGPDHGDNDITRDAAGRVQVSNQGGDGGLV